MIRKHIVVLGAAVALFAASEAIAQAPQADSARRQGELRRGDRPRGERGNQMRQAGMRSLFRGIELTQAQRDQIKTINEKYRGQFQTLRKSLEPDLKAAREARQRGDTVAARAAFERTKTERDNMQALMQQQRTELRALLTVEQQQTFDGNVQEMRDRMEKRVGDRHEKGGHRKRGGRGR
jgi:Spy/CpxP family protein refolding chaperone